MSYKLFVCTWFHLLMNCFKNDSGNVSSVTACLQCLKKSQIGVTGDYAVLPIVPMFLKTAWIYTEVKGGQVWVGQTVSLRQLQGLFENVIKLPTL